MPLALPIWSFRSVPYVSVAIGTNTKLSAKPVMMIGHSSVSGPISRFAFPKISDVTPKIKNPNVSKMRASILFPINPMIGMPIIEPMPLGNTTMPAENAVYPSSS